MRLLIHISIQKKTENKTKQNKTQLGEKEKADHPLYTPSIKQRRPQLTLFSSTTQKKRLKKKNTHKKTQKKKTFKNEINRI